MSVLDFAIGMEMSGEKFYREQAGKSSANNVKTVFLELAKDELAHAEIMRKRSEGQSYTLDVGTAMPAADILFSSGAKPDSMVKGMPDQAEVYKAALKIEQESIKLYEGLLAQATDNAEKDLFQFLIAQEKEHEKILDGLFTHMERPKEWVEDAEFGLREEY